MRFANSPVEFGSSLQSAGGSTNYSAAGNVVDIADTFDKQREKAPSYDELAGVSAIVTAEERAAVLNAKSGVRSAGIKSLSDAKVGQMESQASIKASEAKEKAAGSDPLGTAIGAIAGPAFSLLTNKFG